MKKILILVLVLALACVFMVACGGNSGGGDASENSLTGVWKYEDTENGIGAVYDLKDDGTGTYTMIAGEEEVTYELKYEVQDNHLLVTYVNNDTFTEEDVFDSEFSFQDANTLIVKDSFGEEMTFVKQE
jgi:uncharacterized protein (TIGR03066 family)